MPHGLFLRLLELVRKELGADDARVELGGREPVDPRIVFSVLTDGSRLVVVFAEPPADRAAKAEQLERLVESFGQTLNEGSVPPAPLPPLDTAFRRLDAALEALRSRTGSTSAVIIDLHSPVLWGSSEPQRHADDAAVLVELGEALRTLLRAGLDIDALMALDENDLGQRLRGFGIEGERAGLLERALSRRDEVTLRHHLLTCLAVARARREAHPPAPRWAHHEPQFGYFVRSFANIYLLITVFEGAFSELHVESGVLHALPSIERLLMALPPIDPSPGGRVIRLRRDRG
jgi:hypothetical protein